MCMGRWGEVGGVSGRGPATGCRWVGWVWGSNVCLGTVHAHSLLTVHPPPPPTAAIQRMYEQQEGQLDSPLIEGHLNLTVELIHGLTSEERFRIGSQPGGLELIKVGKGGVGEAGLAGGWIGWGRTSGWSGWGWTSRWAEWDQGEEAEGGLCQ